MAASPTVAAGKSRWTRGYGVWVHDVFAYRGFPAGWKESLIGVREIVAVPPSPADEKKLRCLGSHPSIVRVFDDDGERTDFATASGVSLRLHGGLTATAVAKTPPSVAEV